MLFKLVLIVIIVSLILTIKRKWAENGKFSYSTKQLNPLNLSRADALTILGLQEPYTKAEVHKAYKRLMNRVHPDKGGSEHFAMELNAARDRLVRESP